MNIITVMLILVSVILKTVFSTTVATVFSKESVAEQQSEIYYKRVESSYFGKVPVNLVLCAFTCTNEDNCRSIHIDGEACVFGVYDVIAFAEGEMVTPDSSQVLRIKSKTVKALYISYMYIYLQFQALLCRLLF